MIVEFMLVLIGIAMLGVQFFRVLRGPLTLSPDELEAVANYYEELYPSSSVLISPLALRSQRRAAEIFAPYDSMFLPDPSPLSGKASRP